MTNDQGLSNNRILYLYFFGLRVGTISVGHNFKRLGAAGSGRDRGFYGKPWLYRGACFHQSRKRKRKRNRCSGKSGEGFAGGIVSIDLGFKADQVSGLAVFGEMRAQINRATSVFGNFETDLDRWNAAAGLKIRW